MFGHFFLLISGSDRLGSGAASGGSIVIPGVRFIRHHRLNRGAHLSRTGLQSVLSTSAGVAVLLERRSRHTLLRAQGYSNDANEANDGESE